MKLNYIFVTTYNSANEKLYLTEDINFAQSLVFAKRFNNTYDCEQFLSSRFLTISDRVSRQNLKKGIFITTIDIFGKVKKEDRFI